jgi:hypothetical protein
VLFSDVQLLGLVPESLLLESGRVHCRWFRLLLLLV